MAGYLRGLRGAPIDVPTCPSYVLSASRRGQTCFQSSRSWPRTPWKASANSSQRPPAPAPR